RADRNAHKACGEWAADFRARQRRVGLGDHHQRRTDDRAAYAGAGAAVTMPLPAPKARASAERARSCPSQQASSGTTTAFCAKIFIEKPASRLSRLRSNMEDVS